MTNAIPPIRDCRVGDVAAIQAIYAHHVLHGLGSFEETPPDVAEMQRRVDALQAQNFPFLVGVIDDVVGGYAYAGPYRLRSAYRYTVEDTVYVDATKAGKGLGRALLSELIKRCTAAGDHPRWQRRAARIVHIILLIAPIYMPVGGIMFALGKGYEIGLLGLPLVAATKTPPAGLEPVAHVMHGLGGLILGLIILFHIAGAVKHQFIDRDGTMRRMLGRSIASGSDTPVP